ncbi:MAG: amidophosphoribosyltransferase [Rhodobacteraceae bacterium]|nr:amidophosphoribosyltransferase [Paracoccaceae bacterium]MAY45774.1 amidophosphoribosyltransferase [Paracoccaceae bacterium]
MHRTLQTLLTLVYPPRCLACGDLVESDFGLCPACWRDTPFIGGLVCESCGVPLPGQGDGHRIDCDDCMTRPRPWDRGRSALLYKDTGRKLVLALKHGDRTDIARTAATWMARAARPIIQPGMLVAPVPLHRSRLGSRRYNQSALLAQGMARALGLDHCPDLFQRPVKTPSLDGRGADERADILRGAIRVHPWRRDRITGRSLLLVDDVMTSGATLAATAEAAHAAGAARVCVITLARVAKDA